MGKKTQRGTKGKAANLVRYTDVSKIVQLPEEKDFRRLCILRGVYPKENPKERDSPHPSFHKKDLSMVNNDPMAWFIRDHAAWVKKRNNKFNRQEPLPKNEPKPPYDKLIRSRYPEFADAIQELDDALTTVALFAQMKGSEIIPSDKINRCRELLTEFHYYVSHTHSLKCAFISIRGFHFEAEIEGQSVLWLVPFEYPIPVDSHVDYEVLLNFLELYENLLKFVNFRLFTELGMKYPPEFDREKWNAGLYFDAIKDTPAEVKQEMMAAPAPQNDETNDKLKQALASVSIATNENQASVEDSNEIPVENRGLFSNFYFTLCRGTPRNAISFIIRSLGGGIIWDEDSKDKRITHTVIDRDEIENRVLDRKYIQSQWVVDCLNKRKLLDVTLYAPGVKLPPHLSPWESVIETNDEIGENDEREIIAGGEDSDEEIDEEIKRAAMEADYAEGINAELAGENDEENEDKGKKQSISEKKAELKKKKKEEKERLAAGTLTMSKMKLYKELKEKEEKKKNKNQNQNNDDIDNDGGLNEDDLLEEEEEEEKEEEEKNE